MIHLDADAVRQFANPSAQDKLASIEVFAEIESTNSYLMQSPGPPPGKISIAATSNQTAGRGRHGKTWLSPPGSGLCLSAAYTFAETPDNLPALTLALGVGAIGALEDVGANNVKLKWPNDLVARDGKLGGMLTEVQQQPGSAVTVVTGIGINVDLPNAMDFGEEAAWASQAVDLKSLCNDIPDHNEVAGKLVSHLLQAFASFGDSGLDAVADQWANYDWLFGREITVDVAGDQFSGLGAGMANDGALLVETRDSGIRRVTSGTIVRAGVRQESR